MIRSFLTGTLILLCTAVFESAVLSNITFLPSIPDLSLLCILFISLNNGKTLGETSGFVNGLFLDFLSACPFGFNCLFRTIIGYVGGNFCKILNTEGFFVPFFLAIIVTAVKVVLIQIISLMFPSVEVSYKLLSFSFVFELLANGFLAPFVFRFLRVFKNTLVLKPENVH
ncbi:MAG: rod shape-determining protein MreD [Treponema sp.]|nr:rod shape-determining protein MreD [Candidatus Treponema equi]